MEKLQQLTKYDRLADNAGIVDKNIFLDNIKALAKYDETYKIILDNIIKLSEEYIDVEPNMKYRDWIIQLGNIYHITTGLGLTPLYNIICNYTNTPVQKYLDYEDIEKTVYDFYIRDYNKFIELIKQVITPSGRNKWDIVIPKKSEKYNSNLELDSNGLPKVPYVPL